ncbi:hypothetical protein SEA_HOLLIDAY_79 [Gordonia phage Holliday]|nr:hypothetical protein SEA_HOLLIDAY_79 [Gordonia phage Holliday]
MSGDPAIAAAQRAWDARYVGRLVSTVESAAHDGLGALAIAAAREALAPLRELHRPFTVRTNDDESWVECHSCVGQEWPCQSARLLYSSSELEGTSDAQ